jgi:hypothetical protein
MIVLLIAGSIALVLGISLLLRRGNATGLGLLRGTHPGKPMVSRFQAEPGQLALVGRAPIRSDRRMLTPKRRRR